MCAHRRSAATLACAVRPGLPSAIRRDGVQHGWASYSETFRHVLAAAEGGHWLANVAPGRADRRIRRPCQRPRLLAPAGRGAAAGEPIVRDGADHDLPSPTPSARWQPRPRRSAPGSRDGQPTGVRGPERRPDAGGPYRYRAVILDLLTEMAPGVTPVGVPPWCGRRRPDRGGWTRPSGAGDV